MHAFQLTGLDPTPFAPMFDWDTATLQAHGAVRLVADANPGYPCRVSLQDAEVGDTVLLLAHTHHDAASPYRASGPIFVRRGARRRQLAVGEVPLCVTRRLISWRAYDTRQMMVSGEVCEGAQVAAAIQRVFDDPQVAYIHLHNARQGCYSCCVDRALPGQLPG